MTTETLDTPEYRAVEAKDYADLTAEDLDIVHEAEQKSLQAVIEAYQSTGQIAPSFFNYVSSTITYGSVHHAALIEKKAEFAALQEAGDRLRDAAVAYVTTLEQENAELKAQLRDVQAQ